MNHIFKAIALKIEQLNEDAIIMLAAMLLMAVTGTLALLLLPRP